MNSICIQFVEGRGKMDYFMQSLNFVLVAHQVEVRSLHLLLQFVSLAAFFAKKDQFEV